MKTIIKFHATFLLIFFMSLSVSAQTPGVIILESLNPSPSIGNGITMYGNKSASEPFKCTIIVETNTIVHSIIMPRGTECNNKNRCTEVITVTPPNFNGEDDTNIEDDSNGENDPPDGTINVNHTATAYAASRGDGNPIKCEYLRCYVKENQNSTTLQDGCTVIIDSEKIVDITPGEGCPQ